MSTHIAMQSSELWIVMWRRGRGVYKQSGPIELYVFPHAPKLLIPANYIIHSQCSHLDYWGTRLLVKIRKALILSCIL